jgi:dihydrofolate reductase
LPFHAGIVASQGGSTAKLKVDISMSLDGYVAGPNPSTEHPLGGGGEQLHQWAFAVVAWRERHGLSGGERNRDSEVVDETLRNLGATIMGRRMYSGGQGPWESDANSRGWWGDDPPFHHPVFVLTRHPREPLPIRGGTTFTFVTDGPQAALEQARAAAGDKDVAIGGGADVVRRYLDAGLLDEPQIHHVPVLLGGGSALFANLEPGRVGFERTRVVSSPTGVVHVKYRVLR